MASIIELFKTSTIVGTLYTLNGPNLAALATLSGTDIINHRDDDSDDRKKEKQRTESFLLGIRWGIGNSLGILLVGTILISLQSGDPDDEWVWMDDWLHTMLQAFVGVFLLILGIYGIVKALRNREYSMGANESDLEFKKSSMDSCSSVGLESAITEIVVNRIFDDHDDISSDSDSNNPKLPPQKIVPMKKRYSIGTDSIVDQMVTCLDANDGRTSDDNLEANLGLSEFDLKMWQAAKALTDNMMLYADDDWSFGSKSVEASIRTIDMSDDMRRMQQHGPIPILTKEDDTKKTVTRTKCDTSRKSGSASSSKQRSNNNLLKSMSRCGSCLYCTPGVLAVFAGLVHGLSGPGEVLGVVPAVQLKKAHLAILYLSTFCVTSTLVMGGFACFYGSVCKCLVSREGRKDEDASMSRVFLLEFGSACLSIVVGIIWLTLLAVGELDAIAVGQLETSLPVD
jgi:hypothetical protein